MACTVFTGGCNFRCPFCHNASLVTELNSDEAVDEEKFFSFLKKRQGILDGVCVTGGEPLLNKDLPDFLCKIKDLGYKVKLDTNGSFPDTLKALIKDKLVDFVAMDIKNSKAKYAQTAGIQNLDLSKIEESVDFLRSGAAESEVRTTLVRELHSEKDMEDISEWIEGAERYFIQAFVDSGNLIGSGLSAYTKEESEKLLAVVRRKVPNAELRGI